MMRNRLILALFVIAALLGGSAANAYTLTFDDVSGYFLTPYAQTYGAWFDAGFRADNVYYPVSAWAHPHSGYNVVAWHGGASQIARIDFGYSQYAVPPPQSPYSVISLSAYFCTAMDAVVRLTAFASDNSVLGSVLIGAAGQSWRNHYVEFAPDSGPIDHFVFEGFNSTDDLRNFCADDMTIVPVPEPSSLSLLTLALASVGVGRLRRQRQA